jgi:hypothetical protein
MKAAKARSASAYIDPFPIKFYFASSNAGHFYDHAGN